LFEKPAVPGVIHGAERDGREPDLLDGLLHDRRHDRVILPRLEAAVDDERGGEDSELEPML
jgi:hypothetical protein